MSEIENYAETFDTRYGIISYGTVKRSARDKTWWFTSPRKYVRASKLDRDVEFEPHNYYFVQIRFALNKKSKEFSRWEKHYISEFEYNNGIENLTVYDIIRAPEDAFEVAKKFRQQRCVQK